MKSLFVSYSGEKIMVITTTERIDVSIIPDILNMPMFVSEAGNIGYVPISFFTTLGVVQEEIENILDESEDVVEISTDNNKYFAISHPNVSKVINTLARASHHNIFKVINDEILILAVDSKAIVIDDYAEEIKNDQEFWSQKIAKLPPKSKTPIEIAPHPNYDFDGRHPLEESLAFMWVSYVANLDQAHDACIQAKSQLKKMLIFHDRESQYNYFLYHLLMGDDNICLLTQTLFIEWIESKN